MNDLEWPWVPISCWINYRPKRYWWSYL